MARPPKSETVSTGTSAREIALAEIEKSFGKGAIFRMSSNAIVERYPSYGTGILGLDIALGAPIPKGRIIEIYGPESSGKTTLTLHIAANVQKTGGTVAFVDAEHALDLGYAQKLGVNVGDLDISQPDCGEQALDIADLLVKSGAYNLIVIDSVAALTPKAELEGDMGDSHMGLQARLMSQALRKLTGSIARSNCTVIFINQLRMKIGVMFGNPETTTGGNALKFYASQRMDVRKTQPIKVGEEVVGYKTKIKIIKNKMAPPFKEVELDLLYGQGFDPFGDLLDKAVQFNLIQKSGSWFSLNGEKIGQGREQVRNYLKSVPETVTDLTNKVHACVETGELPIEQD
jgi:recombination protein RecA